MSSSINNRSVVAVVDERLIASLCFSVYDAQSEALKLKLPLGIVSSINFSSPHDLMRKLASFKKCETMLSKYGIPLVVMVTDKQTAISAVTYHFQPAVLFQINEPNGPKLPAPHPYSWPGKVLTIQELIDNIEGIKKGCL